MSDGAESRIVERVDSVGAKVAKLKLSVFKAILHSAQNMECAQRKRELEAKRDATRKGKPRKR